jgi:16S rRNA (cytidine1402-2'-O)-methyltransferase
VTPSDAPSGRLLVCPTPIGNLEDVTLRVLAALAAADVVACEDTRHARVLLDRHGLTARLVSFHEHNERARAGELVARMRAGAAVALVSDAGTPLVSDPGFALVRASLQAGLRVDVLPGPSAVLTALVASGLPAERWCFVGFLPRRRAPGTRVAAAASDAGRCLGAASGHAAREGTELERLLALSEETLIAFESPRRLPGTLALLAARDPERPVAVCRELTKLHEDVRRGSAAELAAHYAGSPPRGEVTLVVGAAHADAGRRREALAVVRELVDAGAKPRGAAAAVAKLTGVRANELYRELTSGGS